MVDCLSPLEEAACGVVWCGVVWCAVSEQLRNDFSPLFVDRQRLKRLGIFCPEGHGELVMSSALADRLCDSRDRPSVVRETLLQHPPSKSTRLGLQHNAHRNRNYSK